MSSICHPLTLKWESGGGSGMRYMEMTEKPQNKGTWPLHTRGIGGTRGGGETGNTVCSGTTGSSHPPPPGDPLHGD